MQHAFLKIFLFATHTHKKFSARKLTLKKFLCTTCKLKKKKKKFIVQANSKKKISCPTHTIKIFLGATCTCSKELHTNAHSQKFFMCMCAFMYAQKISKQSKNFCWQHVLSNFATHNARKQLMVIYVM